MSGASRADRARSELGQGPRRTSPQRTALRAAPDEPAPAPPVRAVPDPFGDADPAGLLPAYARVVTALARDPQRVVPAVLDHVRDSGAAVTASVLRALGQDVPGPVAAEKGDRRYADPAWRRSPAYWLLRQQHGLLERLVLRLVDSADVDECDRRKARFFVRQLVSASAPTNFLLTNPAALKAAYESGGRSLLDGARNFLRDRFENQGRPRQVVPGALQVARDLAVTPGKVVFRNGLMELLQYAPQTETVHQVPLLLSPPWINKYYLLDLAPDRSLVEWAVKQGHTVFVISYRNPDTTMSGVSLDDYLVSGPQAALDVIEDITGSSQVDVLGLCLGGTLTAALVTYLAAVGDDRVRTVTLLNTLLDFSEPGDLGIFTDEQTVSRLEQQMQREGYLSGESMRGTFDVLRADDLLWSYAVSGWLMGQEPKTFDILAWNSDSTRMPAGMHSFYLRSCYLRNELAQGEMELAGQRLDLGTIRQDTYVVAAEQDHIAPWTSVYRGARMLPARVRFVLSDAGHVAGVVNPPGGSARFRVSDTWPLPEDPQAWLATSTEHRRSWWEDWSQWLADRSDERTAPPALGSDRYPVLEDAPGTYARGR
ncbi:MAG: alpha/beta fold hydrolase [Actinomycetota bacterium]|nr:alpha/beta fold hydrolase [Actinomycetota bacterium]